MTSREERGVPSHLKQQGEPNAILPASGLPFLMCFVQDVSPFSVYFLSIACHMPFQHRGVLHHVDAVKEDLPPGQGIGIGRSIVIHSTHPDPTLTT